MYLQPEVLNGASSFTAFAEQEEIEQGLIILEQDIQSGHIDDIMQQYANDLGDYLFIVAEK